MSDYNSLMTAKIEIATAIMAALTREDTDDYSWEKTAQMAHQAALALLDELGLLEGGE